MPTPHNVTPQPRFLLRGGVALPAVHVDGGLSFGGEALHAATVLFICPSRVHNRIQKP